MKPLLLGIHGVAHSGKDTVATVLQANFGFRRMAFADPVKRAAAVIFGWPEDAVMQDTFKSVHSDYWNISGRKAFQLMGTEAGRNVFGLDHWIKRWEMEAVPMMRYGYSIVVSDVRFENEAKRIRELGGHVLHVQRDGAGLKDAAGQHVSEAGIAQDPYDIALDNNGTIAELNVKLQSILAFLLHGELNHSGER